MSVISQIINPFQFFSDRVIIFLLAPVALRTFHCYFLLLLHLVLLLNREHQRGAARGILDWNLVEGGDWEGLFILGDGFGVRTNGRLGNIVSIDEGDGGFGAAH